MSRKKSSKKPRKMAVGIGIEAGSNIEFRWDQKAQELSYRVKKERKTVKPVNTMVSMFYDRPNKNPKIITESSSPTLPPLLNFDEVLTSAAFLIGAEEKDLACRVVRTCFELHFYSSANEERSIKCPSQRDVLLYQQHLLS